MLARLFSTCTVPCLSTRSAQVIVAQLLSLASLSSTGLPTSLTSPGHNTRATAVDIWETLQPFHVPRISPTKDVEH